jgi:hypothetical protein
MEEMDIVQWVVLIYSCTVWTCQGGNKLARVMLEMMTYAGPKNNAEKTEIFINH